jgi:hypothetical protein
MFTAYFDASGQEHQHPYMVVAGFISSAKDWCSFSEEWKKTLHRYALQSFHAVDCQNYEGEFKKWKGQDAKRLRLWCDLLGLIKQYTYQKFGCGVVIDDWKTTFSQKRKEQLKLNAYILCAMSCAERVKAWARRQNIKSPVEYVYESGDPGSGLLKPYMENDGFPAPQFKHKQDRIIDGVLHPATIPLQAADFLAYEIFLSKKIVRKNGRPALGRPIREFNEMSEPVKIHTGERLLELEKGFKKAVKIRGIWRVVHR